MLECYTHQIASWACHSDVSVAPLASLASQDALEVSCWVIEVLWDHDDHKDDEDDDDDDNHDNHEIHEDPDKHGEHGDHEDHDDNDDCNANDDHYDSSSSYFFINFYETPNLESS